MTAVSEIELGLDRTPPATRRPPGWWRQRARRRCLATWRWWCRRWRLVAAPAMLPALLAVLAPAPSLSVSPLVMSALRPAPAEDFVIIGDLLLIEEARPAGGANPVWSAHHLPSGDYRWSMPEWPWLQVPDGPLLARAHGAGTVARDPISAAVRWEHDQFYLPVPGTDLGLVLASAHVPDLPDDAEVRWVGYRELEVIDLASGQVRWSARADSYWQQVVGGLGGVVTVNQHGQAHVRDHHTGRVQAAGQLAAWGDFVGTAVHRDMLVTVDFESLTVRGFDLATLRLRWQHRLDRGFADLMMTGEVVYWSVAGQLHLLIDERTGTIVTLAALPGARPRPWGDRVLLVSGDRRLHGIYDAGSGVLLADLTGWQLAMPTEDIPQRLVLTHRLSDEYGTALAWLDLATGELSYLGRHPQQLTGCASFDGGLVCEIDRHLALLHWR